MNRNSKVPYMVWNFNEIFFLTWICITARIWKRTGQQNVCYTIKHLIASKYFYIWNKIHTENCSSHLLFAKLFLLAAYFLFFLSCVNLFSTVRFNNETIQKDCVQKPNWTKQKWNHESHMRYEFIAIIVQIVQIMP